MHDSSDGQSESCLQPGGVGITMRRHSPFSSGTNSSGHSQTIVRTGELSKTLHRADGAHGDNSLHGSTHFSRIHANLLGQSSSTRHSGPALTRGCSQYESGFPFGNVSGHLQFAA